MAKLEQLLTPQELLAAIRSGVVKGDILKQYKTTDQELAIMLQPLYRGGNMTKDEFNDFFRGLSVKPLEAPAGEPAAAEERAEPAQAPESLRIAAEDAPIVAEAPVKAAESIGEGPIPGLEHAPAELERAVDQAASERPPAAVAVPKVPERPGHAPQGTPSVPPQPKPKPEPPAKPAAEQRKSNAASAPKTVAAPVKAVTRRAVPPPLPAETRPEEVEVQSEAGGIAERPKEDTALDLITVTVEETVQPAPDKSILAVAETEETLRAVLSRLDSIDARLSRIEKKLETG